MIENFLVFMSLNLYQVKILRDERLYESGGQPLKNLDFTNDSPFFYPTIYPSVQVGRWKTTPEMTEYVQMYVGQTYKIQIFNYTWLYVKVIVYKDEEEFGQFVIKPNSNLITSGDFTFDPSVLTGETTITVKFIPQQMNQDILKQRTQNLTGIMDFALKTLKYDTCKEQIITSKIYGRKKYEPLTELIPTPRQA